MDIGYWINLILVVITGSLLILVSLGKLINLEPYGFTINSISMKVLRYVGIVIIFFQSTALISKIFI